MDGYKGEPVKFCRVDDNGGVELYDVIVHRIGYYNRAGHYVANYEGRRIGDIEVEVEAFDVVVHFPNIGCSCLTHAVVVATEKGCRQVVECESMGDAA